MSFKLRGAEIIFIFIMTIFISCGDFYLDPELHEQDLPHATVREYYEYCLSYRDNQNDVAFKLSTGNLPLGLSVTQDGCILGVPQEEGIFDFEITLTESLESTYFIDEICLREGGCETESSWNQSQHQSHDSSSKSDTEIFTLEVINGNH